MSGVHDHDEGGRECGDEQHHDDNSDEDVTHRVHCVPTGPDAGQFTEV